MQVDFGERWAKNGARGRVDEVQKAEIIEPREHLDVVVSDMKNRDGIGTCIECVGFEGLENDS